MAVSQLLLFEGVKIMGTTWILKSLTCGSKTIGVYTSLYTMLPNKASERSLLSHLNYKINSCPG